MAGTPTTGASPAQTAKGALRRLALAHQEPTPENYARAYAEEAGQQAQVLPERARALLERLSSRWADEPARRDELVSALMQGRWEVVVQHLDRASSAGSAQAQAWALDLERLVRHLERPTRQWTSARRKEALQRVLDGSRGDLSRLQQRVHALVTSWESDTAEPQAEGAAVGADAAAAALPADPTPSSGPPAADAAAGDPADEPATGPAGDGPAGTERWPAVVGELEQTVRAGLPAAESRAIELADRLAGLADRLAQQGPDAPVLAELAQTCDEIRGLFAHRHRLADQLGELCRELGQGLVELAEDESWAQGQAETLRARLAGGISARSVRAAGDILAETRERQRRVRDERNAARDALKHLIHRMLHEIGELGAHTDRFQQSMGRHADAVERADSLESLAGVVREMVDESRAVQGLVRQTQQRLHDEHSRASELESRVRALEGELRRLSQEVSTDALTQVANRRGMQQAFEQECARQVRAEQPSPLSVGLLDIDNFKRLNDTLGHAAGDVALKSLAAAVRERLRPQDHLARFGGEEFVVLLPGTGVQAAQQALTRLQRSLSAALFMHEDQEVFVTFSAGVTEWRPGEALDVSLERADQALYEAKRTGKNRTCAL